MGFPLDETKLIARAKEGDAAAYEELVRIYERTAYRAAYVIVGSAADAEEVAHDAFVKAFHALSRFRSEAPFKPWFLRIVANEARNRRRSVNRRNAMTVRAIREQTDDVTEPSPESLALERERSSRLSAALNGLSEEHQLVIFCRYFLDLSEEETAALLGLRIGTAKSRLSRAMARLREEVPDDV